MKLSAVIAGLLVFMLGACIAASQPTEPENDEMVSNYINMSYSIWTQHGEDMTYSSEVLDDFVKGNISKRDALTNTMAVFVLSSQTAITAGKITPPEGFGDYHNYMMQSHVGLLNYLWNLAKFYETGKTQYAAEAREDFNTSVSYRERARYALSRSNAEEEAEYMEKIILGT